MKNYRIWKNDDEYTEYIIVEVWNKCDSKPLNCCWLKLYSILKHYEKQNNEETDNE